MSAAEMMHPKESEGQEPEVPLEGTVIPGAQLAAAEVMSEAHAREVVSRIQTVTGQLAEGMADVEQLVATAYRGRAWEALGYGSWEALCKAELTEAKIWASLEERRERTRTLKAAGMSVRAIGAVLGVGVATVHRDAAAESSHTTPLATVPNGTVAKGERASTGRVKQSTSSVQREIAGDEDRSGPVTEKGLDGRRRPKRRVTDVEHADRALRVAQRRAEGWTQAQIAQELGVSQRTISSDDRMVRAWRDELTTEQFTRLQSGQLSRAELAESVNLDLVRRESNRLKGLAKGGSQSLLEGVRFLKGSVIYADEWLEEQEECSPILTAPMAKVLGDVSDLIAFELRFGQLDPDEMQEIADDLGRAYELAFQAHRRLVHEAQKRGVDLDPEGYRSELEAKVSARQGRRRG